MVMAGTTHRRTATRTARVGLITRVAVWSASHRLTAVGLWLLVILGTFSISVVLGPRSATDTEMLVGESRQAAELQASTGKADPVVENVLVTARDGGDLPASAQAAAAEVSGVLSGLDEVDGVQGPAVAADGQALLVQVTMSGDPDTTQERVGALQDAVAGVQDRYPALRVEQVGPASIGAEFQEWLDADLERATVLSVPVTLVILLVVFGAVVMAGIPVVLALASVGSGLGLWALASQLVPDPGMVLHLLVLMGMAVGVDYSLFYLRRFREERHAGLDAMSAIRVAAATAGHSVVISGTAVVLSMAGLFVANDTTFTAMALGSILVVLVALVSSVTVLPAMLVGMDRWVDKPRVPLLWRLSVGRNGRVVPTVVRAVLAHPVAALLVAVGLLGGLAYPVTGMTLKATQLEDFPRNLATMQSYDRLVAAFPETSTSDAVVVQVASGHEAELAAALGGLDEQVAQRDDLFGEPEVWLSADGRSAVWQVQVPHEVKSAEARESVTVLRDQIVPRTVGSVTTAQVYVGGEVASDIDYTGNLDDKLPLVIGIVLLLVFVMMAGVYRSLAVASITVALNALSVLATFGALTAIFQSDAVGRALGFESTGHVVSWIPMLLFVVLCGLSLDYHVFVVSRVRENALAGMTVKAALLDGVARTAGVVTSAAVVMIGVFSIFGALSFVELKQIGVGLAVGIVLDATIVRVVALPALMLLCRRFLWWPGETSAAVSSSSTVEGEVVLAGRR